MVTLSGRVTFLGCIYLVQGRDGYLGVDNFGDVILVHILVVYGGIGMMPPGAS